MARTCIYPGSFDPLTNGHLNVIRRALRIFDRVIVSVARNSKKTPLFSPEERVDMIRRVVDSDLGPDAARRVKIEHFEGLLVEYATRRRASVIIRGLRAVSDFEYEFQMASMNHKLAPDIEMMFMMTDETNFYISSQTVKEVASLKGCIEGLVPRTVREELEARYADPDANACAPKTVKKTVGRKGKGKAKS
jgi:pantetheine-phosphate adenylyltransferase